MIFLVCWCCCCRIAALIIHISWVWLSSMYFGYISVCVAVCSFEFTFDLFVYVLGICVHKHTLVNYHQIVFYLTLCLSACILLAFFRLLFMKILNWRILRMASCLWLVCNFSHCPYFCLATDYAEPIAIERNTRHSGMWKLIGCALSDRDIDHNSKVLNAFYLFIGYIHFVCLKHT